MEFYETRLSSWGVFFSNPRVLLLMFSMAEILPLRLLRVFLLCGGLPEMSNGENVSIPFSKL